MTDVLPSSGALIAPSASDVDLESRVAALEAAVTTLQGADTAITARLDGYQMQAWSPTNLTGITVGSGVIAASFAEIEDMVFVQFLFVFGSGSAVTGIITMDAPVAFSADYTEDVHRIGGATMRDDGSATFEGSVYIDSVDSIVVRILGAAGTYVNQVSADADTPMTWATGDHLVFHGWYRKAAA